MTKLVGDLLTNFSGMHEAVLSPTNLVGAILLGLSLLWGFVYRF